MVIERPRNGDRHQWASYWGQIETAPDTDLRETTEQNLEARLSESQWHQVCGAIRLLEDRDLIVQSLATQAHRDAEGFLSDPTPDDVVSQFFHLIQAHCEFF